MTRFKVEFEFIAGEETCCNPDTKNFCRFCHWDIKGDGWCNLFNTRIFDGCPSFTKAEESTWLIRCSDCLDKAKDLLNE